MSNFSAKQGLKRAPLTHFRDRSLFDRLLLTLRFVPRIPYDAFRWWHAALKDPNFTPETSPDFALCWRIAVHEANFNLGKFEHLDR